MLTFGFIFCLVSPLTADEIEDLKGKVQALQQENEGLKGNVRSLQERLKAQGDLIQQLNSRLEMIEQKEKVEYEAISEAVSPSVELPRMQVKGFADISFSAQKAETPADASPDTFTLGEFDFMVTSQISDGISFFSENVIEFGETSTDIDIERIYIRYCLRDWLNINIGRIHTPLGYWNATFHHGTWFQASATRPLALVFEHDGGILPVHSVGINFDGRKDIGPFEMQYNLGISNGRSNIRTRVQNMQDGNDNKAFTGSFTIKPDFFDGLGIGFDTYVDKIPPLSTNASRNGEIKELILGGHLSYIKDNLEFLSEGYALRHKDEVSQLAYDTTGFYLQAGYKLKETWTPYYRFDLLDFGQNDPYFSGIDIDNQGHTLGMRWDISTWNALKLEYGYNDRKGASDKHTIILNDSFTF